MFKVFNKIRIKLNTCNHYFIRGAVNMSHPETVTQKRCEPETVLKIPTVKKRVKSKPMVPPGEIYLVVLGNGAVSSSRSLYMFTDYGRYLFNCGEGTQRIAHEYKMKLSKLENIFITYKSWENLGGLLGLSLTVQDIGVSEINIHGPKNIELIYEHAASFLSTRGKLNVKKWNITENFVDRCMEVQYIPIQKETFSTPVDDSLGQSKSFPCAKRFKSNEKERSDVTVCFVCKGHNKPGHLLYEKCVEYGVPPGPLLGELKGGNNITLPSGKTVYAKDVLTEEQKCPVFLVVECPSKCFLDAFVNEEKFKDYQASSFVKSDIASLVVHFTPPHVFKTHQYQEWIARFPETTCHLILNSDNESICSAAVHRIQHKLNLLHPNFFTLLQECEAQGNGVEYTSKNIIQANTLNKFHLRPFKGFEGDSITLDPAVYVQEAYNVEEFKTSLKQFADTVKIKVEDSSANESSEAPEIVFLGTGSSIPSKVRNVSGILVKLRDNRCIIMDCGEGTCNQLFRFYGIHSANSILKELCCIFISHMHADHHLGLIQLLKYRKVALESDNPIQPLVIIGPKKLIIWLKEYNMTFEHILPYHRFYECYSLKYSYKNISVGSETILRECCQDIDISTVPVNHCPDAHGVVLSHKLEKWKIVYSGDTTPCEALITAGKDCTVLIHEATMEDGLSDEAALKRHSTTSEAINVASKMNAKHTILTHFSQRYAKVPLFNENFHNNIGCAFDNMKVYLHELHILPLFIPTLKYLFAEDMQELQDKGIKRLERKNMLKSLVESGQNKNL